jgi:hypothetical protein
METPARTWDSYSPYATGSPARGAQESGRGLVVLSRLARSLAGIEQKIHTG